jgi:hypothetical protein
VIVVLFIAMTFAPIHFVHPFRVRAYGLWLPVLAGVWAVSTCALLWPGPLPLTRQALTMVSIATGTLLFALGLWRTFGSRPAARAGGNLRD